MLKTPIGTIEILINGKSNNYIQKKLNMQEKSFTVDGRYRLVVNVPINTNQEIIVECKLINLIREITKSGIESGERLALISFYNNNLKLSIGVEDEIPNVKCNYTDYGIKVIISNESFLKQIEFQIAWIKMNNKQIEDIYTWFAADPTLK